MRPLPGQFFAEASIKGTESSGYDAKRVDIARIEFSLLRIQMDFEHGETPETHKQAQRVLQAAQHLVVIYPLWLNAMCRSFGGTSMLRVTDAVAAPSHTRSHAWRKLLALNLWLQLLLPLLLSTGCAGTVKPLLAPSEASAAIHVISHGWHTGIVVRRTDIPQGIWPESGDFPEAEFLEVGWGDLDFYQTPEPGFWVTLKAGFLPTPSVLHVVGFATPVADYFSYSEIVEVRLPQRGIAALTQFIAQTHRRDGAVRAPALGSGLYGDSRFYPAYGTFHVFNNCNTWTVRALQAAGVPPPLWRAVLADGVMKHAGKFGKMIQ